MSVFKKLYEVKPNTLGFLYRKNEFKQSLQPGRYTIWDWKNETALFCLPTTYKFLTISNQEVLTKDNVALRFSFNILYKIVDGEKLLTQFALDKHISYIIAEAEQRICSAVQIAIRNIIIELNSDDLNEKRSALTNIQYEDMNKQLEIIGVVLAQVQLKDITFPKFIQDLFAKQLEAKIRAKADLENARTTVATARALKNASEIMKGDDNIKFFQWMETITKIAAKGKHSFMIGDMQQMIKSS